MIATQTGKQLENFAIQYLSSHNVHVLQRNFRCKLGEIDIIAQQLRELLFIEVRYRKNTLFGTAAETVNYFKQRKIIRSANVFLQYNYWAQKLACRFDVLALEATLDNPKIEWIKDAFNVQTQ